MSTIAILPEQSKDQLTTFSAITTGRQATGRTAGEALDALTSQLSTEESGAPVIVQQFRPDQLFSAAQRDRLSTLMDRWRSALETRDELHGEEERELERLVDEEIQGAGERAAHILSGLETMQLRRKYEETWAELKARREQESWHALQLHTASLAASLIGMLLISVSCALILKGLIYGGIGTLIASAVANAMYLLFQQRENAARKRAESLYLQAEESSHGELLSLTELLESTPDRSKYGEQTKAR